MSLDEPSVSQWKMALQALAFMETGQLLEFLDELSHDEVRRRVAVLAVLHSWLPDTENALLKNLVNILDENFGKTNSLTRQQLRSTLSDSRDRFVVSAKSLYQGWQSEAFDLDGFLEAWKEEMLVDPEWSYLPSAIPGDEPIPIDEVYVKLYAISDRDSQSGIVSNAGISTARFGSRQSDVPVVSIEAMLTRTLEQCIVLGEPGSGKSTLVQWVVRCIAKNQLADFDIGLPVRLATYAQFLQQEPTVSILEWLLRTRGLDSAAAALGSTQVRKKALHSRRIVLLLDGWDEVPDSLREQVKRAIRLEQAYFVVVITSRHHGYPKQLTAGVRTDVYGMAGLAPDAALELIQKILAKHKSKLSSDAVYGDLLEGGLVGVASNPFLLCLLVHVLLRCQGSVAALSLADIYSQIVVWVNESYAQATNRSPLGPTVFNGIKSLSHDLLLSTAGQARYVFGWQAIAAHFCNSDLVDVVRSRFISRVHLSNDEYSFLHASFEEYFAACSLSEEAVDEDFERITTQALLSASRVYVLDYLAGIPRAAQRLTVLAHKWLAECDRFDKVVLRLARIAAAGRWSQLSYEDRLTDRIEKALWKIISSSDETNTIGLAIAAYVDLNAEGLCQKVQFSEPLRHWVTQCVIDSLPGKFQRKFEVINWIPGIWQDYAGMDIRGELSAEKRRTMLDSIVNKSLSDDDRFEAFRMAEAYHDCDAVAGLIFLLYDETESERLREYTLSPIARIGGRTAIDALVNAVSNAEMQPHLRYRAAATLRNTKIGERALDATGRDAIIRRLAVRKQDDPCLLTMLAALEEHPIRIGSELLSAIATNERLDESVRIQAILCMQSVVQMDEVRWVVEQLVKGSKQEVVFAAVDLAISRHIPVPISLFEERYVTRVDLKLERIEQHRYFKRMIGALSLAAPDDASRGIRLFRNYVLDALSLDNQSDELAKSLVNAFETAGALGGRIVDTATINIAVRYLEQYVYSPDSVEGKVLLSLLILEVSENQGGIAAVKAVLDRGIAELQHEGTQKMAYRISCSAAKCLVRISPSVLLGYAHDCEPVRIALQQASSQQGWIVYLNRILDSEGREIVRIGQNDTKLQAYSIPFRVELADLLSELEEQSQVVLRSYLAMVGPLGVLKTSDSLAEIHRRMVEIYNDTSPDYEHIREMLPDQYPSNFDAWRKCLNRIEDKFKDRPEHRTLLTSMGLYRRRSSAARKDLGH